MNIQLKLGKEKIKIQINTCLNQNGFTKSIQVIKMKVYHATKCAMELQKY